MQERGDDLEQLALVDRAAAQLEVDGDVIGDRRRGGERRDVLRRGVDDETNSFTSAKFLSAWIPPAVAQAPIVISAFDCSRTLQDPLGVVRRS